MTKSKKAVRLVLAVLLVSWGAVPVSAEDNQAIKQQQEALIATFLVAFPTSLVPLPPISDVAQAVTYGTNLGLKYVKAQFTAPPNKNFEPTTADQCYAQFTVPQTDFRYSNLLGVWDTSPVPSFGALGSPYVKHQNTEVDVSVQSIGADYIRARSTGQSIKLPVGTHSVQWKADTIVDPIFDISLPLVLYGYDKYKYNKAATAIVDQSAKQAAKQSTFQTVAKAGLRKLAVFLLDTAIPTEFVSVTNAEPEHVQRLTVFDVVPPVIATDTPVVNLEASDFGGALYARNALALGKTISAFDPCDRKVTVSNNAPTLLPLGQTTITWTATDQGPNRSFTSNKKQITQVINVADTQPPLMVPPAGKVIESNASGLDVSEVELGLPQVVDLADSAVSIDSDSPSFFPTNSRTKVNWSATDHSGNTATSTQWITVKKVGTNTSPLANAVTASTLTSKPVDIVLRGNDKDLIDGRFDPLSFEIKQKPKFGEFIAPLLPYFINDYRTNPEGPFGEEFRLSSNRSKWIYENYCRKHVKPPLDFVYQPVFITVTDDGTQFITDHYFWCNPSNAEYQRRISKWDSKGNFIGYRDLSDNSLEHFIIDRNGFLYTISLVGAGSSTSLFLAQCSTNFEQNSNPCARSFKFNYGTGPVSPSTLIFARVDSQRGLIYVSDKYRLHVFDGRLEQSSAPKYLGTLNNGERIISQSCSPAGSSSRGFSIDIDSKGYVYTVDSCGDRVLKFSPSFFNASDDIVLGDYVGWMGRCSASTNKACDETKGLSKGFSCTDLTCTRESFDNSGVEQGQFNTPIQVVIDPNDILYVADYGNRRIQRFTTDGTFAGEAKSTGTGINKGESPSFILGNFAAPLHVSVNSNQFFIVDRDEKFVHVFETTPFKDITDNSATVTYVSNFDFHSASDSFSFLASDGLAESAPGLVTIKVARNFRAPSAIPATYSTYEDVPFDIQLEGDDPDGILGRDFNGLDTLTYQVITPPLHGQLVGTGALRKFIPNQDYYGSDSFTFVANDGNDNSLPAVVTLAVEPINDPPKLTIDPISKVAVGFPAVFAASFMDDNLHPELAQQHSVILNWGDGKTESNGSLNKGDIIGAYVISPAAEQTPGRVIAKHVYTTERTQQATLCVTDHEGGQACKNTNIQSISAVNLSLSLESTANEAAEAAIGEEVTYKVTIENAQPISPLLGKVAESVTAEAVLPVGMAVVKSSGSQGSCVESSPEVLCDIGRLMPGAKATITITSVNAGTAPYDKVSEFSVIAKTSSTTLHDSFVAFEALAVQADKTDTDLDGITDSYEKAYGLVANLNDASGDIDGDGVSNLDEFIAGTFANKADSDGDGIDDGWELKYKLDPLAPDASADTDLDGYTNLDEYFADRDPTVDEQLPQLIPTQAVYAQGVLGVPTLKLGEHYYAIQFEVVEASPLILQIASVKEKKIKIQVDDVAEFDPATSLLTLPQVNVAGTEYNAKLKLVSDNPIQIQLVAATVN